MPEPRLVTWQGLQQLLPAAADLLPSSSEPTTDLLAAEECGLQTEAHYLARPGCHSTGNLPMHVG